MQIRTVACRLFHSVCQIAEGIVGAFERDGKDRTNPRNADAYVDLLGLQAPYQCTLARASSGWIVVEPAFLYHKRRAWAYQIRIESAFEY